MVLYQKQKYMKLNHLLIPIALLFSVWAGAQSGTCTFTLELFDTFGDGWNGASLAVSINGNTPTTYLLDDINDNGTFRAFPIVVSNGDTLSLTFTSGSLGGLFDNEIFYALYNPERILVYGAGPRPVPGIPIKAIINCPACLVPNPTSVSIDDVRAFTANISWNSAESGSKYRVEYGLKGFAPGTGKFANTQDTVIRLTGLAEKTKYEFYLSAICTGGDTSRQIGPFEFETLWSIDLGVVDILAPTTQCGLMFEDSITIVLKNFGGNPQSLIPFKFEVNGQDGGVMIPSDGLFTGVLGKDSTFTIPFKTGFDFSVPFEYTVKAWTEVEGERDVSNDTATVVITNIPIIDLYPYFEDFEVWKGGWTLDSDMENSSWQFGSPQGNIINAAASGRNAWVTNLDGNYNNGEESYLVSPCLDFSLLNQDPRIAFSLLLDTENNYDAIWLEMSLDGGSTWAKVGENGTGINWYNNAQRDWWDGDGGLDGWTLVSNLLPGAAGAPDVRLRFVFSSDFSNTREGVGIDDVFISPPLARDIAALSVVNTSSADCGSEADKVTITLSNFGTSAVTGFNVAYSINDGAPIVENVGTLTIPPGMQASYTFNTSFNSSQAGSYRIKAWSVVAGELFPANDTIRFTFFTSRSIPFAENFEMGSLPNGWSADTDASVTRGHGNSSYVLSDNLSFSDQNLTASTPVIGPIAEGDSLTFDYRFVNFSTNAATILGAGDLLEIQISEDCGQTYTTVKTINATNHVPTTVLRRVVVFLNDYIGKGIKIRFRAKWGSGDYWIDIDNVNIIRCPASLNLTATVKDESAPGINDGQATVSVGAGEGPYTFLWSDGSVDKTAVRLAAGIYTVTVSDRFGCKDVTTVQVGTVTAVDETNPIIARMILTPNPTSGTTLLRISLREASDLQITVMTATGQIILSSKEINTHNVDMPIEMGAYPAGLYFVRVQANQEIQTQKLVKIK